MQTLAAPAKCQECGAKLEWRENQLVCTNCGLVHQEKIKVSHTLPYDETFALTNNLAFGKSLGQTLNRLDLLRVLAKGPNGSKDLGLRARQIRILTETQEPPLIHKALERASKLLYKFKFDQDFLVANDVGALIRKCGAWVLMTRLHVSSRELAQACLFYVLTRKYGYSPNPPPTQKDGKIQTLSLDFSEKLLRLCQFIDEQTKSFS